MADERATLDQLLAAVEGRLSALMGLFGRDLAALVRRAPKDGTGTLSPVGRRGVATWLTDTLAALFGASPADAEALYATSGTVPHLLSASTRAAAKVAVAPTIAEISTRLAGQPTLLAALVTPPGQRSPLAASTRLWRDPNGRVLSDRLWMSGGDTRTAIDTLLDYHIGKGSSAPTIAAELTQYLTPEGLLSRTSTPYGRTNGAYASLRLARTETSRAYNIAAAESARSNPFVAGIGYRKSSAHEGEDVCDARAAADPDGLGAGNYLPANFPAPPSHPQCLCYTVSVPISDSAARARIAAIAAGGGDGLALDEATLVSAVTGF